MELLALTYNCLGLHLETQLLTKHISAVQKFYDALKSNLASNIGNFVYKGSYFNLKSQIPDSKSVEDATTMIEK